MSLNPFDLHGPEFLIFFALYGSIILLFIRHKIRLNESSTEVPKLSLTDPYEIAFLRNGEDEVIRICTLSLLDRGLLELTNANILKTKIGISVENARRPVEQKILTKFIEPTEFKKIFEDEELKKICLEYEEGFVKNNLYASPRKMAFRLKFVSLGIVLIGGVGVVKILIAISRGHHNLLFLVFLLLAYLFILGRFFLKKRTSLGDQVLEDLKNLFKNLKERSFALSPGGLTNEVALVAAVFGVSVLSKQNFPFIQQLFPQANPYTNTSCGSSCGSSCGGGGCGGGCGGCGS